MSAAVPFSWGFPGCVRLASHGVHCSVQAESLSLDYRLQLGEGITRPSRLRVCVRTSAARIVAKHINSLRLMEDILRPIPLSPESYPNLSSPYPVSLLSYRNLLAGNDLEPGLLFAVLRFGPFPSRGAEEILGTEPLILYALD